MATIDTTTTATALGWPAHATMGRSPTTGALYVFTRVDASNTYRVYTAASAGAVWSAAGSFTRANLIEWSSVVVDSTGRYLHVAYRVSNTTDDRLFYRRLDLNSLTWSAELQVSGTNGSGDANGGTPGAFWQGVDLAVVRNSNGTYAIAVVGTNNYAGTKYGIIIHGVSITAGGSIYLNNGIIINNRSWQITGTSPGRSTPVCEIEHTGDGVTSSTPHLWISWGRTKVYSTKLSWQGSTAGWQGPTGIQTQASSVPALDYVPGRWDGARWVMAAISASDSTVVNVYERNQANSLTTVRSTPQHPLGVVRSIALSYDASNRNLRVYAAATTNSTWYRIDFTRSGATWGTWVQVSADAVTGSPPTQFTVRRGGSAGNGRFDLAYLTGTVTPWTLKNAIESVQYAPGTPTWDTSAGTYTNGGAANVNAALLLDWTMVDQDPADTQSAYALRRQIGAGAFAWWRASDSTWQASETFNAGSTTALTLASGWAAGSDANYSFAVKIRDTGSLDSPYSAALVLVPSVQVNPTVTAPTASQVLTTSTVTVAWTVAEQKQFRVQLFTNPGLQQVYDSGLVTSTDTSFTVPYAMADDTGWTLAVTTTNNEGLVSAVQNRSFTVDFTEPPAAVLSVAASTTLGGITVAATNTAPSGTQPALAGQDVYRREGVSVTLNANPNFTGNVTGWAGVGGTLTYSTVQAHEGAGSARVVPGGVAANAYADQTAMIVIDPAKPYQASAWVRPDTANKPIQIQVNWYTAGGSFLSNTNRRVNPPVPGVWQFVSVFGSPPATAERATISVGMAFTPAAGDACYVDEATLQEYRSAAGDRVVANLAAGGTLVDRRVAARVPVEYRAVTFGANGTQIAGPWTA